MSKLISVEDVRSEIEKTIKLLKIPDNLTDAFFQLFRVYLGLLGQSLCQTKDRPDLEKVFVDIFQDIGQMNISILDSLVSAMSDLASQYVDSSVFDEEITRFRKAILR